MDVPLRYTIAKELGTSIRKSAVSIQSTREYLSQQHMRTYKGFIKYDTLSVQESIRVTSLQKSPVYPSARELYLYRVPESCDTLSVQQSVRVTPLQKSPVYPSARELYVYSSDTPRL